MNVNKDRSNNIVNVCIIKWDFIYINFFYNIKNTQPSYEEGSCYENLL